ncbi:YrdB family protein [Peribacillus huizhouensis]|uniref:F0F1-type ATP synthase assembly protein I n=1 Tax=Peribacillus huizhouensis TaxID=1501239 RepID=A0ABR6CVN5_9BACI|nr:YrdB family protein [Peribacillus huizhouensis]MBA9029089.1 F0F1-type ATP synthase assembly protein I [Peribacillus huizhouensis]
MILDVAKLINLGQRFILEICALVVYGYWGFKIGNSGFIKGLLCIIIPVGIAVIWGGFGSPKASIQLSEPLHLVLEVIIFLVPVGLLFSLNEIKLAMVYGIIVIINRILIYIWGQ